MDREYVCSRTRSNATGLLSLPEAGKACRARRVLCPFPEVAGGQGDTDEQLYPATGMGAGRPARWWRRKAIHASRPWPVRADVSITGTPGQTERIAW